MDNEPLPTLSQPPLTLRPATEADAGSLNAMLAEPEVSHWWGDYDEEAVREELAEVDSWVVLLEDRLVGWLQAHEEADEHYRHVAFDIALGACARGRGMGRAALRMAIAHFIARGHHRFTIDPGRENHAAIRSYRAVGFKPVGVMRAYYLGPDERWQDALLMDLLAEEFVPADG